MEVYVVPGFARYEKECGIYLFTYLFIFHTPFETPLPQKHPLK
jgi:hypothetical protein